jgi:hypothetical protein
MIGQWTGRVVAVKSLELDVIEKRDSAIIQYDAAVWKDFKLTLQKRHDTLEGIVETRTRAQGADA